MALHFEEASWTTDAPGEVVDSSPFGNHGTAAGAVTPTALGKIGRAAQFDAGGGGAITVPDDVSLDVTTAVTYAVWVHPSGINDSNNGPGILAKRTGFGDATAYTLFLYGSRHPNVDIDDEGQRIDVPVSVDNDTWTHLAVVYDGSAPEATRVLVHVNGELVGAGYSEPSATIADESSDAHIGLLPNGGEYWNGLIDEVYVWGRVLDGAEVQAAYQTTQQL